MGPDCWRWRTERYVRAMLDRLGATSLADMRRVMEACSADPDLPDDQSSIRHAAEDMLKGRLAPLRVLSDAEIDAFLAANARPAALARVLDAPDPDPRGSRFHGLPCLPRGVEWPKGHHGAPLAFLGQFDLDEAGIRPEAVSGTGYLAVFAEVDAEDDMIYDGADLAVVEAVSKAEVRQVQAPPGVRVRPPVGIAFRTVSTLPGLDDPYVALPEGLTHEDAWRSNLHEAVHTRGEDIGYETRIGGWASQAQLNFPCPMVDRGPGAAYPIVMHVGEEHGLSYGDGGFLYLAKGTFRSYDERRREVLVTGWTSEVQTF